MCKVLVEAVIAVTSQGIPHPLQPAHPPLARLFVPSLARKWVRFDRLCVDKLPVKDAQDAVL